MRVALLIYWSYVLIVTFHPFELSQNFAPSLSHGTSAFKTLLIEGWNWLGPRDFLLNILLFLPCGFLLYSLWQVPSRSSLATIAIVTITGGAASFMIEFAQVFASRNSSAIDLISNTLGTAAGAYSYARCKSEIIGLIDEWAGRILCSKLALCCGLIYAALPVAYAFEQSKAPFGRWDPSLTLQLGNEPSWNRPWLGKIYLVALYSRALSSEEISRNFGAGYGGDGVETRTKEDLIALYLFNERTGKIVHDSSQFGLPLDLQLSRNGGVEWLTDSNGINISRPSIVRSKMGAAKLVEAVRATDELSIELWLMPSDMVGTGTSRIISLSHKSGARNFILGQEGTDIAFRLRTPTSGKNTMTIGLQTTKGVLRNESTHLVVTYAKGVERLHLNSVQRPEIFNRVSDGIVGFDTRKTPIAMIAFVSFYFLPVSILSTVFLANNSNDYPTKIIIPVAIVEGLLFVNEAFQTFAFQKQFDLSPLAYGLFIALLGSLGGSALAAINMRRDCHPCAANL